MRLKNTRGADNRAEANASTGAGTELHGIALGGKAVVGDDLGGLVGKVIDSEAKRRRDAEVNKALRKQLNDLLDEFNGFRFARPVPRAPAKPRDRRAEKLRVSFGDLHGMRQDPKAVSALLEDLRQLDPDEIVCLGDMLDCEGWLAKNHVLGFVSNCDYSYQEDVRATNDFLDRVQEAAPHATWHWIPGNHDDRPERAIVDLTLGSAADAGFLRQLWSPEAVLRLKERGFHVYRRDGVYGDGLPRGWIKLGKMHFTHALGKGKNAARDSVAKSVVNVRFGHTHRSDCATMTAPGVGIVKAFNPGCLCLMQPIYMHSDPTGWSQGYDIDFVAKSENFQAVSVPIWRGESLAGAMIERFKS